MDECESEKLFLLGVNHLSFGLIFVGPPCIINILNNIAGAVQICLIYNDTNVVY